MKSVASANGPHTMVLSASAGQFRTLTQAAALEQLSVEEFVLHSALTAADEDASSGDLNRKTPDEISKIIQAAQAEFQKGVPPGVSLVDEFLLERNGKLTTHKPMSDEEFSEAVLRAQDATRKQVSPGRSLVDDLIAERRQAAALE